jgi:hypothetical protein
MYNEKVTTAHDATTIAIHSGKASMVTWGEPRSRHASLQRAFDANCTAAQRLVAVK